MTDNPLGPWGTAQADQMAAAIEDDNWPLLAKIAVDGLLKVAEMEHPDGQPIAFEEFVGSVGLLKQHNLVLMCAEAMRRLYELRRLA